MIKGVIVNSCKLAIISYQWVLLQNKILLDSVLICIYLYVDNFTDRSKCKKMASLVKIISANDSNSQPGVTTVTSNLNLTRTLMALLPEKVSQEVEAAQPHLQKNHLISPVEKCKVRF